MTRETPKFLGIYLFVNDIEATTQFYAALGLEIEPVSHMFARATWKGEAMLEFGTEALTSSYDPLFAKPEPCSKSTINFEVESKSRVDEKYEELTALGYVGHLAPIDALWQARFAIIQDPDGNYVGLHSPRDRHAERNREAGATVAT